MTLGKYLTGKQSQHALTGCHSGHEQGLSGGSHSYDQSTSTGEVLREDGDSRQKRQTVAHTCVEMPVFNHANLGKRQELKKNRNNKKRQSGVRVGH